MGPSGEGTLMFIEEPQRRLIIVGVDESAEAAAAARWAVREAELRKEDLLLVHAYEVPNMPSRGRAAAIARGRQEGLALLDKVASTLTVPPTMHLDRLVEIDSPEALLSRRSGKADLTVLGQDHPAFSEHMPLGHTASTVASMARHPVVAVPRGWTARVDDRRLIAVAIDGQHPSSNTLGMRSQKRACAKSQCWWCTLPRWTSWGPESRTPG